MINGEGTRDISPEVTSPDPLDEFLPEQAQQFHASGDLSPALSRYSSCGESEFERYCSANSVMGTPSMCSSVGTLQECFESEFGSMRSLENFSLGGSFDRNFDDKTILSDGRLGLSQRIQPCARKSDSLKRTIVGLGQGLVESDIGLKLNNNMESSSRPKDAHVQSRVGLVVIPDLSTALVEERLYGEDCVGRVVSWRDYATYGVMKGSSNNDCTLQKENAEDIKDNISNVGVDAVGGGSHITMSFDQVDDCLGGLNSGCDMDMTEGGRCLDEGEASSRYEHSEGEDSMFGYGTDDEKQIDSYHNRCIQYPQDANEKNENPLLMTSSIAFGSDDWDDYMQETGANPLVSMVSDDFWGQKQQSMGSNRENLYSSFATRNGFQSMGVPEQQVGVSNILVNDNEVQDVDELTAKTETCSKTDLLTIGEAGNEKIVKYMEGKTNKPEGINEPTELPNICSGSNMYVIGQDLLIENASLNEGLNIKDDELDGEHLFTSNQEASNIRNDRVSKSMKLEKTNLQLNPLSEVTVSHLLSAPTKATEDNASLEDHKSCLLQSLEENDIKITMKDSPASKHPAPIEVENHELNEFYDDIVHEMEEILLDSSESPGARFIHGNRSYQSQTPPPLRDGSSTASISNSDNAYLLINRPLRIDRVEVVGARQKKGDVSLSERLVGVKEYTVYKIRIWSGEDKWEVERRYRDFFTLYRRLKTIYVSQGWILPSPWSSVERESRKIFGNASPAVISERSVLIQDCLHSLVDSRMSSNHSSPLIWFLSPPKADPSSPASVTDMPRSPFSATEYAENISTFGKTISLVVKNWPYKSTKQILEAQHYTCSGCHKHFDDGKTRIWELVQTLGWGKPRLCEYSGQLFCASCHTNDTAVLPARVLHFWDFTRYPVSQLAKYYLDSIHDQPMLCVSAVNPLLFSKVPALQHVTDVRKKIGAMLPYVHCPFRRTIFKGLGSRRYLLESNDFFALRDLIDLSKGVFAALPEMVETVSRKIMEHITEQCLICCDVGVPCNARQTCDDPSSLIFPFQEGEVERCRSCELVFHKPCFKKMASCPCGVHFKVDKTKERGTKGTVSLDSNVFVSLERQADSRSSVGFLSGLFTKARTEKLLELRDDDNVILMGSLPSTSL